MKVQGRLSELDFRVGPVQSGRVLQQLEPGGGVRVELGQRPDEAHGLGAREVIHRVHDAVLLEPGLFGCERLGGRLVSLIRHQPKLVAQGQFVIIHRHQLHHPKSVPPKTILIVVAHANHHSCKPNPSAEIGPKGAIRGLGSESINVEYSIVNVIRRGHPFELQL